MDYGLKALTSCLISPITRSIKFNSFSTSKRLSPVVSKKHRDILESVQWELGIKTWEDWYNVKLADVSNLAKTGFLKNYSSLAYAIAHIFPEHPWNMYRFASLPSSFWKDTQTQRVNRRL